ncbi:MAG: sugar transferase, partial [Planctomycetota bacterium]|nr:sugar transferase [Planctomycetota bacterium]
DLEVISATLHQAPVPTTRTEFSRDTPRDRGGRLAELWERLFNLGASFLLLMLTLPLYPILMLIIWLEDGRPFFFAHERQMKGGKFFRCYKFRTMCRDAEKLKGSLQGINNADGPQFHIPIDPRLTRCGRWMRRFHLDELPQFFNVLKGEMNLVGPRPSPENENQCCPAWREIRLSVRPGITGLWQVCRTRKPHLDFQEWIRYDIEYVRHRSMKLDQWILWRTIRVLLFTK